MSKQTRSLLVWLIVAVNVVAIVGTFLFCLPDYTNIIKADYGKSQLGAVHTSTTTQTLPTVPRFPININTATKEELMYIRGIGDTYASRIIDYRDEIGGFSSLEQLLEVKGIGEKRLDTWREYLVCE